MTRNRFIFLGKAKDVFDRLKLLCGKEPAPEPMVIYLTEIITPATWLKRVAS